MEKSKVCNEKKKDKNVIPINTEIGDGVSRITVVETKGQQKERLLYKPEVGDTMKRGTLL